MTVLVATDVAEIITPGGENRSTIAPEKRIDDAIRRIRDEAAGSSGTTRRCGRAIILRSSTHPGTSNNIAARGNNDD